MPINTPLLYPDYVQKIVEHEPTDWFPTDENPDSLVLRNSVNRTNQGQCTTGVTGGHLGFLNFDNAKELNGLTSHIRVPANCITNFSSFTIVFGFKTSGIYGSRLNLLDITDGTTALRLYKGAGTDVGLTLSYGNAVVTGQYLNVISSNSYNVIAITVDGSYIKVYLNGLLYSTLQCNVSPLVTINSIVFGGIQTTGGVVQNSKIGISDIIFFNGRVLDPKVVAFLYFLGLSEDIVVDTDKNFVYVQTTPSTLWYINHQMNKYPATTVFNVDAHVVDCYATIPDVNNVILKFSEPFVGKASFN